MEINHSMKNMFVLKIIRLIQLIYNITIKMVGNHSNLINNYLCRLE